MKKLIKKNNKSVSKFQLGGIFFIDPTHPERTWVNAVEARRRGIPLTANPRDPNAQWTYSYDILDPTPGTRPNSIDEHPVVNPESVYFLYDPNTGKILNQEAGIIDSALGLVPLDESWAYHPRIGWFLPNANGGEVTNPDVEMTRNFLGNTLGWEQAYRLPADAVDSMGEATTDAMIQGATGVAGGEVLGTAAKYTPKVMLFVTKVPRTTSAAALFGLGAATTAAALGEVDPITKYMENVGAEFTDNDYNNLSNIANLDDILLWLGKNGYNITKLTGQKPTINTAYIVHPNENKIFGVDAPIWWDNGAAMALWGLSALKNFKVGKWALPAYIIGSGAVRSAYFGSDRAKARMLANYLTSHGYIDWEGSKNSYNVLTDQSNNPQITDTARVIPQMQDSAATPTPYNEYQGEVYDLTGELINPDYIGFETDTASNE